MSGQRIIVLEANEVPPRVFRWYAEQHPGSAIAALVAGGGLTETANHDLADLGGRELYPSQTWATLATGVAFAEHGVYWYGDPKPAELPLYWQLAARAGKRVGIVGTLHSSPLAQQANDPNIVFAIPDCFAADPVTRPERYRAFQRLNLAMTRGSGRVVAARPGLRDLGTLATSWRFGVRARSFVELARLGAGVVTRHIPRERLRAAQFVMQADIFESLVRRHDPDLAVLFTNHVASMMHRYWFASFPSDWRAPLYDEAWIGRYRNEITHAMGLLDRSIGNLVALCNATGRGLVVTSSMGQVADTERVANGDESAIVRDVDRFVSVLSSTHVATQPGMVPQITVSYGSVEEASRARTAIDSMQFSGLELMVDQLADTLTVTYFIDTTSRSFRVDGVTHLFSATGIEVRPIDDHRSGTHDPIGSWLTHGVSMVVPDGGGPMDVLEVAPTILATLDVEPAAQHRNVRLRTNAAAGA